MAASQLTIQVIGAVVLTVLGVISALFFDKPEEKVVEEEVRAL
jgi:putative membrane protein